MVFCCLDFGKENWLFNDRIRKPDFLQLSFFCLDTFSIRLLWLKNTTEAKRNSRRGGGGGFYWKKWEIHTVALRANQWNAPILMHCIQSINARVAQLNSDNIQNSRDASGPTGYLIYLHTNQDKHFFVLSLSLFSSRLSKNINCRNSPSGRPFK